MTDGWTTAPTEPPRKCHRCGDTTNAAPIIEKDPDVGYVPTVLCRDREACDRRMARREVEA